MEEYVDGNEGLEHALGPPDEHGWRSRTYSLKFNSELELLSYVQSQLIGLPEILRENVQDVSNSNGNFEVRKTVSWRDTPNRSALVTGWVFPSEGRYMLAEEVVGPEGSYYCFRLEMSDSADKFDGEFARRRRLIEVKYDAE